MPDHGSFAARPCRVGLLSTFPPRLCGLATFASALERALSRAGNRVDVVRIDDGDDLPAIGRPIVGDLVNGDAASVRRTANLLSRCDVAVIQHEYGIFGGVDGDEIIDLLIKLDVPSIVTLHTVPLIPSDHQRTVLESVCDLASAVVVMTGAARTRLVDLYEVDGRKVVTIPHGATLASSDAHIDGSGLGDRPPQLLTWGLLGPGKGIEHVIDALALLGDVAPRPRYTVAGVTHPKVFSARGDEYRHSLIRRAWANGVVSSVTFDDSYRDLVGLTRFVASSSIVVLPYDSRDQVTSGVLVDAIAAGRPVIATEFPHAVELLSSGAGATVPHADPVAMAHAIKEVLQDGELLQSMVSEARRLAPSLSWSSVATRYLQLAEGLIEADASIAI